MKRMDFEKYIGFNLHEEDYNKLRDESFSHKLTVSELLRRILKERYKVGKDGKKDV